MIDGAFQIYIAAFAVVFFPVWIMRGVFWLFGKAERV